MSSKHIIIGIGALIILGAGYFLYSNFSEVSGTESPKDQMISDASTEDTMHEDTMMDDKPSLAENEVQYALADETTVSYEAEKKWLKKPVENVVGTNENVTGQFVLNTETGEISNLDVRVDKDGFVTDSKGRDKDVRELFTQDIVISSVDSIKGMNQENFEITTPLEVDINGVKKEVPFTVTGAMKDGVLMAEGKASVLLTDFNIKPFSLLGVYEVGETLGVNFSMVAQQS